jgi:hypothetical protein
MRQGTPNYVLHVRSKGYGSGYELTDNRSTIEAEIEGDGVRIVD